MRRVAAEVRLGELETWLWDQVERLAGLLPVEKREALYALRRTAVEEHVGCSLSGVVLAREEHLLVLTWERGPGQLRCVPGSIPRLTRAVASGLARVLDAKKRGEEARLERLSTEARLLEEMAREKAAAAHGLREALTRLQTGAQVIAEAEARIARVS